MPVPQKRLSTNHFFLSGMVIAIAAMACAALFISCEYTDEKSDNYR